MAAGLFQQGGDHSRPVEAAQVRVRLTRAHKHNRLASCVRHGDGSTDLPGQSVGGNNDIIMTSE